MISVGKSKREAMRLMDGNWKISLLVNFLYAVILVAIIGAPPSGFSISLGSWFKIFLSVLNFVLLKSIVIAILAAVFRVGIAAFHLELVDGGMSSVSTFFGSLREWKTVIPAMGLRCLLVLLGMVLLIVPGVIAHYNYALVPYLLADDPTMSPGEALRTSRIMMRGHRWELFLLRLSFFGWILLSIVTVAVGGCFLSAYRRTAVADFYRSLPIPSKKV